MTLAQVELLEKNLTKFIKWENGQEDSKITDKEVSTMALEGTVKMLTEKTGKKNFTYDEVMNPKRTLEMYKAKNG